MSVIIGEFEVLYIVSNLPVSGAGAPAHCYRTSECKNAQIEATNSLIDMIWTETLINVLGAGRECSSERDRPEHEPVAQPRK